MASILNEHNPAETLDTPTFRWVKQTSKIIHRNQAIGNEEAKRIRQTIHTHDAEANHHLREALRSELFALMRREYLRRQQLLLIPLGGVLYIGLAQGFWPLWTVSAWGIGQVIQNMNRVKTAEFMDRVEQRMSLYIS